MTQLDLLQGELLRDEGIDKVSDNNQVFIETMRGYARMIIRNSGSVTTDSLRVIADQIGLEPNSHQAWGAIFRSKEFEACGYTHSRVPSNHGRLIRRWRLK